MNPRTQEPQEPSEQDLQRLPGMMLILIFSPLFEDCFFFGDLKTKRRDESSERSDHDDAFEKMSETLEHQPFVFPFWSGDFLYVAIHVR